MGYNSKTPLDLAELKKQSIPILAPVFGCNSFGAHKTTRDFVDLKLGRLGDPGEALVDKSKIPHASVMDPSSSRKARARGNVAQVPSCLVDGCRSDLSTCRDYHRRHKVCEVHSKTPIVTIGGQERRFCQQCSRFHSLGEFDEGKRSCRKRLEGHNRRRRKPQPQSITLHPGRFLSNYPGARYMPFSNPQLYATRSLIKAEDDPTLYDNNTHSLITFADRKTPFPGAPSPTYDHFSFSQGATSALAGEFFGQTFPDHNGGEVVASDRALSLLSCPPSKTREFGFSNDTNPALHSLISSAGYGSLRPPIEPERGHSQGMFRPETIGGSSMGSMPHQTLFFSWE